MGFLGALGTGLGIGATNIFGSWLGGQQELKSTRETNASSAYEAMLNRQFQRDQLAEEARINKNMMTDAHSLSEISADKSRAFATSEASMNRAFQQKMSNTAMQRRMEDLKKAGLNPMLAYTQGGATGTAGAQASSASAQASPVGVRGKSGNVAKFLKSSHGRMIAEGIRNSVTSAMEYRKLKKDVEVANTVKEVNKATAGRIRSETAINEVIKKIREYEAPSAKEHFETRRRKDLFQQQLFFQVIRGLLDMMNPLKGAISIK